MRHAAETTNRGEVRLLRQELRAVRERMLQDLEALDARLARMLPDEAPPPKVVTDWKAEVRGW